MKQLSLNPNPESQHQGLTRFRALNFVEDQLRVGMPLSEALRQASHHPWPDENGDYYAWRTIEDWWYVYCKGGFDALVPQPRKDRGTHRKLDAATSRWVVEQVTLYPAIALKVLYTQWIQDGRPVPSLSVLYRHLRQQGLDRKRLRSGRLETGPTKAFEAPAVNELWMVDFSPGPTLVVEGKSCSTQLCLLVDDHSRLIPFAAYYPQANTEAFHHCLKEAILRRGVPRKLYTDQGKPFVNGHTRIVCAQLGIRLLHCKPYHAWSKGKCERLIQTVQTGFESTLRMQGNQATSLEHLNAKFTNCIQSIYHLRAHGSTSVSPEARYQQAVPTLRHWDPSLDIEPLFYLRLNRTVRKNGTIRLDNDLYEVPLSLRTLEVQLRLDPWRRHRIEVWYQDKFIGLARKAPLHLNSQTSSSHDH